MRACTFSLVSSAMFLSLCVFFSLPLLAFTAALDSSSTAFTVDGSVLLEDSEDHSGTEVAFYSIINPGEAAASTLSDADGNYSLDVAPGFYLIKWEKYGYLPQELGDFTLNSDTTLNQVMMQPGFVQEVCGEVSGTWSSGFVYHVTCDIEVPDGETLTVEEGVTVRFAEGVGMTCHGTLVAEGTEEDRILLTTLSPTPLPGDWDNVELYGSSNLISYVDYEYATDGFTGDFAGNSTFDHIRISSGLMSLDANGINLSNSSNMTFTNNEIGVAGDYCIRCSNCDFSEFTGNSTSGAEYGIRANDSYYLTIENNVVEGFKRFGIYFDNSPYSKVNLNVVTIGSSPYSSSETTPNSGIYNGASNQYAEVNYNEVTLLDAAVGYRSGSRGIVVHDSEVVGNSVSVSDTYGYCITNAIGIYSFRSTIQENEIFVDDVQDCGNDRDADYSWNDHGYGVGILSLGNTSSRPEISNNTIEAHRYSNAILATYADIHDNELLGVNSYSYAIFTGHETVISDNTISGYRDGVESTGIVNSQVVNNDFSVSRHGFYAGDASGDYLIEDNSFTKTSTDNSWMLYLVNSDLAIVQGNDFTSNGGPGLYLNNTSVEIERNLLVTPGRGLELTNEAGGKVLNNTLISIGNGDYGIKVSNLSTPVLRNNIVQGFETGMQIDNDLMNTNVSHNALWNISGEQYTGTALAPLIGESLSFNANSDSSDVYGNIYMDPMFVGADSLNYNLLEDSPCINAGSPSTDNDPDGTIADIGKYHFDGPVQDTITDPITVTFTVDGSVLLEDSEDHSGTEIAFYSIISPGEAAASTLSDADGNYSLDVAPGFYLIKWEKYGYLPQELGDFTLNSDTTLNQVMMQPGFVQEVCGEVSGTWTAGFVYHVTCDITVPDGETLTIEEGVTVRFAEGVGMTCNGTLVAEGTEEDRILLTTLSPTPLPGDWDNVELYGSSNLISYVDYEYATDGFTGDFAGNSTFDHIRISSGLMSLDADGINLSNSSNMTFTNNEIGVAGDYCIRCSNCDFSEFTGNSTSGAEYGIRANDSYYLTIENNVVEGFKRFGIYFDNSPYSKVNLNVVTIGSSPYSSSETTPNSGIYNGASNQYAEVNYNEVTLLDAAVGYRSGSRGIVVHDSEVVGNSVSVSDTYGYCITNAIGIYSFRSTIQENEIFVDDVQDCGNDRDADYSWNDHGYGVGILSLGNTSSRPEISNNTIEAHRYSNAILATYADIHDNELLGVNSYSYAIFTGHETVISDNTISGYRDGVESTGIVNSQVVNNDFSVSRHGFYAGDASGDYLIEDNSFTKTSTDNSWMLYLVNSDLAIVQGNDFTSNGGPGLYLNNTSVEIERNLLVTPGRGLELTNEAGGKVLNNTLISIGNGDYGIKVSNLSTPVLRNNIVQGFETGMQIDNDLMNTNVSHNALWNISGEQYTGTALAPLIGESLSFNANSDSSDVYGNIYMDPMFVGADSLNYNLLEDSPCINAGSPSTDNDPDGTIADIGKYHFDGPVQDTITDPITVTFTVDGSVLLEDSEDHSGTEIAFYSIISPGEAAASTLSDADGNYSLDVAPGFYLIKWEKYGYLPQELGDFTLNSDTTLNQVMMQPGFVQEVCGEVSGTWSSGFVYHVTCDIEVPDGETLTVEEGVTVRFAEGVGMTCHGTLVAEGTEEDRILLTTLSPTPLPGDWDNVELYGSSNLISYVDYEYATDGFTGDFAGNSTFDHIRISSGLMSLDANGINLSNSSNMTFTNNEIGVAGDYCIRCSNCDFSEFTGNSTSGAEYGIRANDSYYLTIENNVVEGFKRFGIYFDNSPYSKVNLNVVTIGSSPYSSSETTPNSGIYNGASNQYAEVNYNEVTLLDAAVGYRSGSRGIVVHDSEVVGNSVSVSDTYGYCITNAIGIYSFRSTIQENEIFVDDVQDCGNDRDADYSWNDHGYGVGILSLGNTSSRPEISNNTIEAHRYSNAILATYADIHDNELLGVNSYSYAIFTGHETVISDNTISGYRDGVESTGIVNSQVVNNDFSVSRHGFYAGDASGDYLIEDNSFTKTSTDNSWMLYLVNSDLAIVQGNDFTSNGGPGLYLNNTSVEIERNLLVTPGRGLELTNEAGGKVLNNTLISTGNGDYGIKVSNLSTPVMRNNIVQGYQTGMQIDNDLMNTNVSHNALWNISGEQYTGTALAPLIGENNSFNANGDESDVYGNIYMDPMFVAPDSLDYNLSEGSPCVNAGDPSMEDPDGSIVDMGAFFSFYYGCTDAEAFNYDLQATIDDGSCEDVVLGCTDENAVNYEGANTDDGSCTYAPDCTDALACNYNDSTDQTDNTLCEYPEPGYNCDGSCILDMDGDGICDEDIFEEISCEGPSCVTVSGSVLLENVLTDHSGTEVAFYSIISPGEASASTLSDSLGNYSLDVAPGFYLIKWEKYGYLPQELGDFTLNSDTTLNQVMMQPGFVQEVCGEVSGTWSSGFVYHVTCDVVVPEGETLTIEEGVTVRFAEGVGMTCNGNLIAEGTEDDHIRFTTLSPTPLPGDWDNVELYATDNVIRHLDYEFAMDGITGDLASNTTVDHLSMNSMDLNARGVHLTNSFNMSFTGNDISVAGEYGIYCNNCDFSEYLSNEITGPDNGIHARNSSNSDFVSNEIEVQGTYGIDAYDCDFSRIDSNVVRGYDDGVQYAIYAPESYYVNVEHNDLTEFRHRGVYFQNSANAKVNHNTIEIADSHYANDWSEANAGIFNSASNQFAEVNYNSVTILNAGERGQGVVGIMVHDSEVLGNMISVSTTDNECYQAAVGVFAHRSKIQDNTIWVDDHVTCGAYDYNWLQDHPESFTERSYSLGILSLGDGAPSHEISGNTIEANNYSNAIWSTYAHVHTNEMTHDGSNHTYATILGTQSVFENNIITDYHSGIWNYGSSTTITENEFSVAAQGIYANSVSGDYVIEGNTFNKTTDNGDWFVYLTNAASVTMKNNEFTSLGGHGFYFNNTSVTVERNLLVTPGRGLELTNQAGGKVLNNTLISTGNGDYGIKVSNLSTPVMRNNIVQGYQTGMQIDNDLMNTNVSHNALWNISGEQYTGTALAPLIGEPLSFNANSDSSDVYGNIYMDPMFVGADSLNYNLLEDSPCINAGSPSTDNDPDGTIADIGKYYFDGPVQDTITDPITVTFTVDGSVLLEDSEDHSGTEIAFYSIINPGEASASTLSDSLGNYSLDVAPGFYLIKWEKYGYLPQELGDFTLNSDTTLNQVMMQPGFVQEVCGEVSGTWSSGFVYHVTCDVVVPEGETLTIEEGVTVRFAEGVGMTCNGNLIAEGTEDDHIRFTTLSPTPLPGDWDNVELYATDNVIRHLDYEFAMDGITGDLASNTTVDHLSMNSMDLNARGVHLTNSFNMSFTGNDISVAGEYGIYCNNCDFSEYLSNEITGPDNGIHARNSSNSDFVSNEIEVQGTYGIDAYDCDFSRIDSNVVRGYDDGVQYAIYAPESYYVNVEHNDLTEFRHRGVYFQNSANAKVNHNTIEIADSHYANDWSEANAGIFNSASNQFAEVNYNSVTILNAGERGQGVVGIMVHDSEVLGNMISVSTTDNECYQAAVGVFAHRSKIQDNTIWVDDHVTCGAYDYNWLQDHPESFTERSYSLGILSLGDGAPSHEISGNTIEANNYSNAIWSTYAHVHTNEMTHDGSNHTYATILGTQSVFENNIITDYHSGIWNYGSSTTITENEFSVAAQGIYANSVSGDYVIEGNTFNKTTDNGDWFVYLTNAASVTMKNNEFTSLGGHGFYFNNTSVTVERNLLVTPGRGLELTNQAGGKVLNNTLISTGNGDYGIKVSNLSTPVMRNNIVQGYQTGMQIDNDLMNTNVSHNALWNISGEQYTGTALAPLIGEPLSFNANSDSSDVYGNIYMDPMFVGADSLNYNLLEDSPCINAGSPSTDNDPDGTIADIGKYYFDGPVQDTITDPITVTFTVDGSVLLEDSEDHSGTEIAFYSIINPGEASASTLSDSLGNYSLDVAPGFYLIKWEKYGYLPQELGDFTLNSDTTLNQVMMQPGFVQEVCGEVSGTWSSGFVYHVTCDVVVPEGETLTIEEGVTVRFAEGVGMTCNGNLIAEGTEDDHIRFTTLSPTPLPGDWDNVELYATDNVIRHLDYEFAMDGITGDLASNTTVDHLSMNSMDLNARGVHLTNSFNMSFTGNDISVAGEYGIYCNNCDFSEYLSNEITGPDNGIHARNSSNSDFVSNEIEVQGTYGIDAYDCDFSRIDSNVVRGYDDGVQYAIYAPESYYVNVEHNDLTEFRHRGVYFQNSANAKVNHNTIEIADSHYANDWSEANAGIFNSASNQFAEVNYNSVTILNAGERGQGVVGIMVHDSEVLGNMISVSTTDNECYQAAVGVFAHRSKIQDNTIWVDDHVTCGAYDYNWLQDHPESFTERSYSLGILSLGDGAPSHEISGNTIEANNYSNAIWSTYAHVHTNEMTHDGSNHTYATILGTQSVFENNIITDYHSGIWNYGSSTTITENEFSVAAQGIYANSVSGDYVIEGNTFNKTTDNGDWFVYLTNAASVTMKNNEFTSLGGHGFYFNNTSVTVERNLLVTPGRGLELTNQAGGKVLNNTLISTGNGDYGIKVSNLSTPVMRNNIVQGYQTGMQIDNDLMNTNVSHNALWNISGEQYTGTALAPLIGEPLSFNANSDSSDVYGNIYMDPMFVAPDSMNYYLSEGSPCVNAGDPTMQDIDGTVIDMGAYFSIYFGCMDAAACNYNPDATADDGSCDVPDLECEVCMDGASVDIDTDGDGTGDCYEVLGCDDSSLNSLGEYNACNYSPEATENDGSCEYVEPDYCVSSEAFIVFYTCDGAPLPEYDLDGNGLIDCLEDQGCTDDRACNYDASVNYDDGSCDYGADANMNGICDQLEGCLYANACNYDAEVVAFAAVQGQPTFDTESCDFSCLTTGCSIPDAINFDPYADGNHDDTCTFIGCQDTEAINFDPNANYPGECIYLDPCPGDFSGDGVVDIVDLLDLFTMWDDVCTWVID